MEKTLLTSQLKLTHRRDRNTVHMVGKEPALLVTLAPEEGEHPQPRLMRWSEIQETFEIDDQSEYAHLGEVFIRHRETGDVYTYLDNRKGLQKHHPYELARREDETINPVSRLTREEYSRTLKKARRFVRPEERELSDEARADANANRTYILQIVSTKNDGPNTNLHDWILKRKHPYLRVITGKANPDLGTHKRDVYELGFNLKSKQHLPFVAYQGCFRSPDKYNFLLRDQVTITNIAISREEAQRILHFTMNYHQRPETPMGFHFAYQNCTVFIRKACEAAGIDVPTLISKTQIVINLLPDIIHTLGRVIRTLFYYLFYPFIWAIERLPDRVTDPIIFATHQFLVITLGILESIVSLSFLPLRAALGGLQGEGGREFDAVHAVATSDSDDGEIEAPLWNPPRWFTFFKEDVNLPGVLQKWQEKQPSTDYHKKERTETQQFTIATREI